MFIAIFAFPIQMLQSYSMEMDSNYTDAFYLIANNTNALSEYSADLTETTEESQGVEESSDGSNFFALSIKSITSIYDIVQIVVYGTTDFITQSWAILGIGSGFGNIYFILLTALLAIIIIFVVLSATSGHNI